jgi:thiol-disulfide isomerase/thioredoxin
MASVLRAWCTLIAALLAFGCMSAVSGADRAIHLDTDSLAGVQDGSGKPIPRSTYKDQVVVLEIWASWCSPCVAQLPRLQALAIQTKRKGIAVIPISIDTGGALAAVRAYARKNIVALPLYVGSPDSIMQRFGVEILPNTLIFDPQGGLVARFSGLDQWDEQTIIELAARLRSDSQRSVQ